MKVKIEIDTKTFIRFWLVVIGFGLFGLFIYSARSALLIIGIAVFFALALSKPVTLIAKKLPGKSRLGGTALAYVSIVVILIAVIGFVLPPLIQQTAKLAQGIPSLVEQADSQWSGLRNFIDQNGLRGQVDSALENMKDQSAGWAANITGNIASGIGSLASFLVSFFLVIVLSFLVLVEGPSWMQRIWSLYHDKPKRDYHKKIVDRIYSVVTGYINGQLTVSAIGALTSGLCVFLLSMFFADLPTNLAMPTILIVFILSLIPMFGATIAGVLVGLMLLLNSATAAIIYVVYFIVYQQIENNLISPTIQAKKVELSALIVLVSVTIGIYVAGLIGGVIAIPIAGTIKVLFEEYISHRSQPLGKEAKSPLAQLVHKSKKI